MHKDNILKIWLPPDYYRDLSFALVILSQTKLHYAILVIPAVYSVELSVAMFGLGLAIATASGRIKKHQQFSVGAYTHFKT